jgi:hypothetical protein
VAPSSSRRLAIGVLAGTTAVAAGGGATYGLAGARDVPPEWLEGSPFGSYRVPSIALGAGVGGTCAVAALAAARDDPRTAAATTVAGAVLTGWIVAQVATIGLRSPLQPIMAGVGVALLGLGRSA